MNADRCVLAPTTWQDRRQSHSIELGWSDGHAFADLWRRWRANPVAPAMLHHVVFCDPSPDVGGFLQAIGTDPLLQAESDDLRRQWFGLEPGVHQLRLSGGRVRLSLCIGPVLAMLRDSAFLAGNFLVRPRGLDVWVAKALARLATVDAPLRLAAALGEPDADARDALQLAGFRLLAERGGGVSDWCFRPPHGPGTRRAPWRRVAIGASRCIVVGAGLAGAGAAAALAERGWCVEVLERSAASGAGAGAGAGGLPAGLLVPSGGMDPGPRRLLLRAGARLSLQRCHELLQLGRDWEPGGVLQLQPDPAAASGPQEDAWSRQYEWPQAPAPWMSGAWRQHARWHKQAAWIRPPRLVGALLSQTGVRCQFDANVDQVLRADGCWRALDPSGQVLAEAEHILLANAMQAARLVRALLPASRRGAPDLSALIRVEGQLSWGLHDNAIQGRFPPCPVNGFGSFMAGIPLDQGQAWFAGATYERSPIADPVGSGHAANLERLARLLPAAANLLQPEFDASRVQAWRGERCTSPDRLPICGKFDDNALPGLWISTAMGSRGLTLALLCGELIAAQACAEPLPVSGRAARLLRPERLSRAT